LSRAGLDRIGKGWVARKKGRRERYERKTSGKMKTEIGRKKRNMCAVLL